MPKYIPSQPFKDCWSSVGEITFYHRDGICYWKKRARYEIAGTEDQVSQESLHKRALEAWRSLEQSVQDIWSEYAVVVPSHRPPFDEFHHISGYNLFVSAYHGFAQLGRECVPVPTRWEEFPVLQLEYASAEAAEPDGIRMVMQAKLEKVIDPTRYRVLLKIQLTSPGKGRRPGYMRNALALSNCSSSESEVEFLVEDVSKHWSVSGPSYQVHCRYLLVDTLTGYRSDYRKDSFLFKVD